MHYGFQSTGSHFLDFNNFHLEPGERPEDLYQRLNSFVDDNLLRSDGNIRHHHGDIPAADEEMSPTVENIIVLTWLRLIHKDLPFLVKQRYGTVLRSQTLASLKPEISQALDSLLDEVHASAESKVFWNQPKTRPTSIDFRTSPFQPKRSNKICALCEQAGRPNSNHFLSASKYLTEEDRRFMTKSRQTYCQDLYDGDEAEVDGCS